MLNAKTDPNLFFRTMDDCPRDKKVLLLNQAGIAQTEFWHGSNWFIGWHPLPKIPVEMRDRLLVPKSNIGMLLGD